MRTYWCKKCEKCVDVDISTSSQCKCGYEFVNKFNPSNHINMRNTWSKTTQVEFSQTTIDKDIAERNAR